MDSPKQSLPLSSTVSKDLKNPKAPPTRAATLDTSLKVAGSSKAEVSPKLNQKAQAQLPAQVVSSSPERDTKLKDLSMIKLNTIAEGIAEQDEE